MRSQTLTAALALLITSAASAQIGSNITGLTILSPPGPPLEVETLSVGAFTVARANLTAGSIVGKDSSGNFQTTWAAPYTAANPASDLNLTTYLAKNDVDTGGPTTALPLDVLFGGQVGVTSPWKDRNGASNPDFFLFDAVADATIGLGGDAVDIAPILPGGVIGQSSFFLNTGFWGDSGINVTGGPNNGQSLLGIAFSVTDLLDDAGVPLSTTSQIQGLRILSNTLDTALIAADVATPALPLELQVNATTGAVSIRNPNPTEYTLGFNFYRISSASSSLVFTNWSSLDDQEGADPAGQGWEEGGGSTGGGPLAGDYNTNGAVDAADYTVWRDGLGTTFTQAQYDTWKNNFGATAPPTGSTNQLVELNLDGLKSLGPNSSVSLGNVFAIGGTNDLVFNYGVAAGQLTTGTISLSGAAAATAVPEPATWALVVFGLVTLFFARGKQTMNLEPMQLVARPLRSTPIARMAMVLLVLGGLLANHASAVVVADDTFAYPTGAPVLGNNGGTGWSAGWTNTGANTTANVIDTSSNVLEYLPAGTSLISGGNEALQVFLSGASGNEVAAARQLATPLSSTFYVGYLMRYDGSNFAGGNNTFTLHLSNSATNTGSINFGIRGGAPDEFVVRSGTGIPVAGAAFGGQLVDGAEYYLVGKITYDSNTNAFNKAEVWLNPEATDPVPDMTLNVTTGALSSISHAFFRQAANQPATDPTGQDTYVADRLVIGSSWADVVGEVSPTPGLVIDRATGQIALENEFGVNFDVVGYSLTSAGAALRTSPGGWTPIAGRLDQAGTGSFDNDGAWSVSANSTTALAEGVATGDGGQLAATSTVGIGSAWLSSPIEDVKFSYQLEGGTVKSGLVRYTGAGPLLGDFDRDGTLDKDDFVILSQGSFKNLASEPAVSAYYMGDIDLDKDNDFNDFTIFRQRYIAANGAAAFAALTAVPEPGAMAIALAGVGVLVVTRWRAVSDVRR